jgi:predicted amidohydrolase
LPALIYHKDITESKNISPSMPLIKVASGVVNQTPMAWEANTRNIVDAIREARKQDVSLLCLPELCISGYGCDDYFFAPDMVEQAQRCLLEIARRNGRNNRSGRLAVAA